MPVRSLLMRLLSKPAEKLELTLHKRRLERACRQCGVSRSKATAIAALYFNEVVR